MAACGSLQHIFEKPLPEKPTLLESLSPWNQIKKNPSTMEEQSSSFTEIFGELHFKESSHFQTPSSVLDLDPINPRKPEQENSKTSPTPNSDHYSAFSRSSAKYGSHKNCTEGLGFESSDEVEHDASIGGWQRSVDRDGEKIEIATSSSSSSGGGGGGGDEAELRTKSAFRLGGERRSRGGGGGGGGGGGFPPPISSLSKSGKARVCFESYREDGRFVLKEIRVRRHEFLHACREDGRLKLQFVQPNYDDDDDGDGDGDGDEQVFDSDEVEGDLDEEDDVQSGGDNKGQENENGYLQEL